MFLLFKKRLIEDVYLNDYILNSVKLFVGCLKFLNVFCYPF